MTFKTLNMSDKIEIGINILPKPSKSKRTNLFMKNIIKISKRKGYKIIYK